MTLKNEFGTLSPLYVFKCTLFFISLRNPWDSAVPPPLQRLKEGKKTPAHLGREAQLP